MSRIPTVTEVWKEIENSRPPVHLDPYERGLLHQILYGEPVINAAALAQHMRYTFMAKTRKDKTRKDKTRKDKTRKDKTPKVTIKGLQLELAEAKRHQIEDNNKATRAERALTDAREAMSKILGATITLNEGSAFIRALTQSEQGYTWPEIYAKVGALKQQVDVETLMRDVTSLSQQVRAMTTSPEPPPCRCGQTFHP